ncbi:hypothetical protein L1049_015114 [Liquidambar formosana]|uniref:Uncharacterized protein n=1 Tax=Liquidambar formosana TaxID=63359 RepID=A0AAP0S357_LIQFO
MFLRTGFASDSVFGRDVFSATSSQTKQDSSAPTFSAGNIPVSSTIVPVSAGTQPSVKQSPLESLQSPLTMQPVGGQLQQTQSPMKPTQQLLAQGTSAFTSSGISVGAENSASSQSQVPWPKMTQSDVQKYTKVFVEVDTDRDGKITGEQARNLFMSWKLPREILKQVWDLSDQDNDSMLSLREFCTALYLMERFREGRPLPAVLPSSMMFDFPTTGQPSVGYGNGAWGPTPGFQPQQVISGPGARQVMPASVVRPPVPLAAPKADEEERQINQQKSRVPVLEKHLMNQLSKEEQNSLNSKFQEAMEADKKVEELEKEILESREKIEFCRTKMQELVLYKSRCDNRLNEITERASADRREVESLAKKYEEKYKQVGDIASKLTTEEATFRDIQEKKMELYQAIVKMEQDGSADGILQVRADRIQSDLDELVKSLNERCKKYGLRVRPTTLAELPFGWQPGIQEGAADWDEDWDKFEDDGFTFVKELTLEVQNVIAPPRTKSTSVTKEKASTVDSPTADSSNADIKSDNPPSMGERALENGSAFNKNEDDSARSALGSPAARSAIDSPSRGSPDSHFGKPRSADASPHAKETHSDQGGAESFLSGDRTFDEPPWGTFDSNDDIDSVWGFNSISIGKEMDHESHRENFFYGSGELGLNPIRTESPQGDSIFQRRSPFTFADSVPSTPLFSSSNSPRYNEGSEHSFDNFSRFDSFSMHDSGFFPPRDSLARFDSMRSTSDFDHGRETLARFDSIRSTKDFDHSHGFPSRFDSMRSTSDFGHGRETLSRFDSIQSYQGL